MPVYFHVINKGAGVENGDVTLKMLRAQIDVLNASYSGATGGANTPYRLVLAGVDRTTNLAEEYRGRACPYSFVAAVAFN